jgi:hypothetical protein
VRSELRLTLALRVRDKHRITRKKLAPPGLCGRITGTKGGRVGGVHTVWMVNEPSQERGWRRDDWSDKDRTFQHSVARLSEQ